MEVGTGHADPLVDPGIKHVRRPVEQKLKNEHTSGTPASSSSPPVEATQLVGSVSEGNALVKRLRQLESENVSLANSLTKMCEENAVLTKYIDELTEKTATLSSNPLAFTSVLHSLFEPEKTGWFKGSKAAARENLEKLSESLQNEFIEYRASHASSNEEVQVLIAELQNAHANAQRLSLIVQEQQEAISRGPLSVSVRVVSPGDDLAESVSLAELRRDIDRRVAREEELQRELRGVREERRAGAAETARLQRELLAQRGGAPDAAGLSGELERQRHADDTARLTAEVARLREALTTQEQLHAIRAAECKALTAQLRTPPPAPQPNRTNNEEGEEEEEEEGNVGECAQCAELRIQADEAFELAGSAERAMQLAEQRLANVIRDAGRDAEAAQMQREMQQHTIAELESKVKQSVGRDLVAQLEGQNKSLLNELEIAGMRSKHLEDLLERERGKVEATDTPIHNSSYSSTTNFAETVNEAKVLEMLELNKERISRLEFEREELVKDGRALTETIAAKDEELLRANRTIQEDKQRINFLLKRAVDITAELKNSRATCEGFAEEHEKAQLDLSKLRRQVEEVPILHQRIEEMRQKQEVQESRLSSVEEVEAKLVKAKETIAYMEVAKSQSINLSEYAELQSKNANLENTLEPIKRQLEEAKKEVDRLRDENQALQGTITHQKNQIQTQEESLASLNANDAKLREKSNQLNIENTRLVQLNQTLEKQMENMQDGIKEMAVNFEQERERTRAIAETQYRGEIEQLQGKLAAAKQTLDDVQSSQDQFVPEGIHRSLIAEKERSDEENKRKSFDIDKLKSEIIIYRQTIDDLEAENEEHVRHIERLQAMHQKERSVSAERLASEQNRLSEAERELESLRASLKELTELGAQTAAQQSAMDEAAQKHRRAYEEKCRQESQLSATLASTRLELEALRGELDRAGSGATDATPARRESANGAAHLLSPSATAAAPAGTAAAALRARAEDLQVSLVQAQQQLEAQGRLRAEAAASFQQALDGAAAEASELRAQVQSLEAALAAATSAAGPAPRAKRKKSAKKGLAALAQANEGLEEVDVLAVAGAEVAESGRTCAACAEARAALARAEEDLDAARAENKRLLVSVQSLSQDLQSAQSDLELATADSDRRTHELKQQILFLEGQLKAVERSSAAADAVARAQALAEDNQRLRAQLDAQQRTEIKRAGSQLAAHTNAQKDGDTVAQLREELCAKDKEIAGLARELLPTKNKLAEFMAMADRLGIKYPFTAAMEGAAVLRLRAIHFDGAGRTRACSAPRPPSGNAFSEAQSASGKKKRRRRREVKGEEQVDLR